MSPSCSQPSLPICSRPRIFAAVNGMNGSMAIAIDAVICSETFRIVFTRSGSVLASFHGSVSARYLLPSRAMFIASLSASRKR